VIDFSKLEKKKTQENVAREAEVAEAMAYLQSTDWQVVAKYERKRPIPGEVQVKRKAALDIVTAEPATET
jgi:hypothetical protein